jgi:hypothetical protein
MYQTNKSYYLYMVARAAVTRLPSNRPGGNVTRLLLIVVSSKNSTLQLNDSVWHLSER